MADPETIKKWEELRQELAMWQRMTMELVDELIPKDQVALAAPWWVHEGFLKDPSEPEPKASLIQSAIIWELAVEAISKNELSETSTTLIAIKESGVLQNALEEQAGQLERAAKNLRMKSASLARK